MRKSSVHERFGPGGARGHRLVPNLLAVCYAALVLSAPCYGLNDGTWVKVGEAYFPFIGGTVAAPTAWGSASLLSPVYAVGPDGIGVVAGSGVTGSVRICYAQRLDGLGVCGYFVMSGVGAKWVITSIDDDALGAIIPTLIGRQVPLPLLSLSQTVLGGIINTGLVNPEHAVAVSQFIAASGIPSVAIAAQGRSLWFVKWVSDSLAGRVPPNPPFDGTIIPNNIRNTMGFVGSLDWDRDGVLNITKIASNESPLGSAPVTSTDFAVAGSAYSLSTQTTGASGSSTVYNTPNNSRGGDAFYIGAPKFHADAMSGDIYRIEWLASDGSEFNVPWVTVYRSGMLEGTAPAGSPSSIAVQTRYYYPGGSSFYNGFLVVRTPTAQQSAEYAAGAKLVRRR
jgi:hypothetical protein